MRYHRALTCCALAVALVCFAAPASAAPSFKTLEEAVTYVRGLASEGRSHEEIASEVTAIVDSRITNVNSPERFFMWPNMMPFGSYFNSAEDEFDRFRARSDSFDYDKAASWVWENQYGQCEECASLSYYLLKQAGVDGNVRIFSSAQGQSGHNFVVWGVEDGADPNDPSTWGADAYVVDGWQGETLDSTEAAQDNHVSNDGEANIADRTKAHDKSATVWKVDPASTSLDDLFSDECIMEALFDSAAGGDAVLAAARGFRDGVLAHSAAGRRVIDAYYAASSVLVPLVTIPETKTPGLIASRTSQ